MQKNEGTLSERLREETIRTLLKEDSRVLDKLNGDIKKLNDDEESSISLLFKEIDKNDINERTLKWWDKHQNGFQDSLSFIKRYVEQGAQPIFLNLSYYSLTSSQTLYVPTPYHACKKGFSGFAKTVWVNAPERQAREETNWEFAARDFSHACSNIPYSVRIGDKPTVGWLTKSHETRQAHYIPDVENIYREETPTKVFSAAKADQPYLGMASVLYIPLAGGRIKPIRPDLSSSGNHARAVLMLWSPIPNRWDYLMDPSWQVYDDARVLYKSDGCLISDAAYQRLGWIEDMIARDSSNQVWREAEYIDLAKSVLDLPKDSGTEFEDKIEKAFHGLGGIITALDKGRSDKYCYLPDIVSYLLDSGGKKEESVFDFLSSNRKLRDDTSYVLYLRGVRACKGRRDVCDYTNEHLSNGVVTLEESATKKALREPIRNVSEYSVYIKKVEIYISDKSLTIRISEKPKDHVRDFLIGGSKQFKNYYASRRGIPTKRVSGGERKGTSGLGMSMYSAIAERVGVFNRFYISPNEGIKCYALVSLPKISLSK